MKETLSEGAQTPPRLLCRIYDEVVEKSLLSNTFFTNTLPLLECVTYRTARSVFYHLLTSAEA